MNLNFLHKLLENHAFVAERIETHIKEGMLQKHQKNKEEITGHLLKAEHNLYFVHDNIPLGYYDWCITGCYYAVYHAALALIINKGYTSKNHDATLCVLIKEYYRQVSAKDIELINRFFLDYQEILFYAETKQRREDATYSTTLKFDKKLVTTLRTKAALFIDKAKQILA